MAKYDDKVEELEAGTIPEKAVAVGLRYGQIEGDHHRAWVIDQMLRILAGERYQGLIDLYETSFDDPEEYAEWDVGIAP